MTTLTPGRKGPRAARGRSPTSPSTARRRLAFATQVPGPRRARAATPRPGARPEPTRSRPLQTSSHIEVAVASQRRMSSRRRRAVHCRSEPSCPRSRLSPPRPGESLLPAARPAHLRLIGAASVVRAQPQGFFHDAKTPRNRPTSWAGETRSLHVESNSPVVDAHHGRRSINRRCAGRTTVATILPGEVARVATDEMARSDNAPRSLPAGRPAVARTPARCHSRSGGGRNSGFRSLPGAPRGPTRVPASGPAPCVRSRPSAALSTARFDRPLRLIALFAPALVVNRNLK